ncbi:MAG: DUF222 domain-containing protein [Actinomycetota bacterium]
MDLTGLDKPCEAAGDRSGLASAAPPPELMAARASLKRLVQSAELGGASTEGLAAAVDGVRAIEHLVAALTTQIAHRAAELAEAGEAPGPVETLLGTGRSATGRQARREASRAALTGWWPEVGVALAKGEVGPAAVDALARQTERLDEEQRSRLPRRQLLDDVRRLPVDTFARLVGRVVARLEHEGEHPVNKRARSSFHHWFDDETGMGRFNGALDPERYEAFVGAIEQHLASLAATDPSASTKGPGLAATALYELVIGPGSRKAHLPLITVVVDADGRAETGDGRPLADEARDRLLCDAVVQRVTLDKRGLPINVGRRHRTATAAQWTAIRAVHRTCAWHGCPQPLSRCQLHHLHEWQHGGPTDLANLIPLCGHHHHLVHEGGWRVHLTSRRELVRTAPGGRPVITPPPGRSEPALASGPAP